MHVDIHAHVIPPELLRAQQPAEAWRPHVFRDEQGRQKVEHGGTTIGSAPREFVALDCILAEQEAAEVDIVALSPWTSLLNYHLPAAEAQRSCRLQSELIARYAAEHPQQVAGMGIVPLQDGALAARETEYLARELKLRAVEVGSNVNGAYLGEPQFWPFWEAAASLDLLVFVHPVPGVGGPLMQQYDLGNLFGNPSETGLTGASLIFAGVLERFPTLRICLAHGGGVLPYIIGRMDQGHAARVKDKTIITRPPSSYLRQMYFDTITHSLDALRYLVALVGADHVLMGSDYPFDMGYAQPRAMVDALNLPSAEADLIRGQNAARLLRLNGSGEPR